MLGGRLKLGALERRAFSIKSAARKYFGLAMEDLTGYFIAQPKYLPNTLGYTADYEDKT